MKLHNDREKFKIFIELAAQAFKISENNILRDYYIVLILERLATSEYVDKCVFKGGTSLSKCYPKSIERFSEDIDLTFVPVSGMTDKKYERELKKIEQLLTDGFDLEKLTEERNSRNKSSKIILEIVAEIKIEIGSSVKPEPYSIKGLKSYIHQFLEIIKADDEIVKYDFKEVKVNVLNIERTFVDKVMAVKRHAICGTLNQKVRHIYDVHRLFGMEEIKRAMSDKESFVKIVQKTKETDSHYLEKRKNSIQYDPKGPYDFVSWQDKFDEKIKKAYEKLHEDLLYTNEKQNFEDAKKTFEAINDYLKCLNE